MINTKMLVMGALLAVISALFQLVPAFFSEAFIIITILSALPIYIISRMNPKVGIAAYIVAGVIVMLFSVHEGIFFLLTNGIIGCSLGATQHYTDKIIAICSTGGLLLTIGMSIMSFIIGFPVFGVSLPGNIIINILIMLAFSLVYSFVLFQFSKFIFKQLNKLYFLDYE